LTDYQNNDVKKEKMKTIEEWCLIWFLWLTKKLFH